MLSDAVAPAVKTISSRLPAPDKRADALAGLLVTGRGLFGQIMHAAVDVGVELTVEVIHRLDHAAGL